MGRPRKNPLPADEAAGTAPASAPKTVKKTRKKRHRASGTGILSKVAEKVGFSVGTVSRAFNNSPLVPPATRDLVFAAARALGVRPRVALRVRQIALVTEMPHSLLMGGYVSSLTQYLCYALSRAGVNIALISEDRLEQLTDNRFDGVIGIAWQAATLDLLRSFVHTPVVWFSDDQKENFHVVYVDGVATGTLVGDYLLAHGHRRIAVIHDPDYSGVRRNQGVRQSVRNAGGDPDRDVVAIANDQPLQLAVKAALDAGCTAVWVTGEDMKVLEVNWLLQELAGKRVPEDISLVGFENPGISEFARPAVTTVASPLREMAEKAVEIVLAPDALTGPKRLECLEAHLIERASVRSLL